MNYYLDIQCQTMLATVATFEQRCELAAMQDDGKISKEEQVALKKIKKAVQDFTRAIEKATK